MRVLIAASEVAPILKLGGLGDVVGALPKALQNLGVNADVIVPFFSSAKIADLRIYKSIDLEVPFEDRIFTVGVYNTKLPGSDVDVLLLKNDELIGSWKSVAFANNFSETYLYAFFSRCVVEYIKSKFNVYDVIHCNDWHTGLITQLLAEELGEERPGTLFTIHNLLYQGVGVNDIVRKVGLTPGTHPLIDYDAEDGSINLIFQGITSSDYVNTVSESYAQEILTEEYGKNLADTLQVRQGRVSGILNGIDYSQFPRNYDKSTVHKLKPVKKKELQQKLGLTVTDAPIYAFVSRLDPYQKGLDILFEVLPDIVNSGGQFVLEGTGEAEWEGKLRALSEDPKYKGSISINLKFDVALANYIYCGSDFLIVPSRYEPCGLTQMIAMWYGTLPIVHAVGGLKDTVKNNVNGFTFEGYNTTNLLFALNQSKDAYRNHQQFSMMIDNAISENFSWEESAKKYFSLYEKIIKFRKLRI